MGMEGQKLLKKKQKNIKVIKLHSKNE